MTDRDKILSLLIQLKVIGQDEADLLKSKLKEAGQSADDLAKSMGVVNVSQDEANKIIKQTTESVKEGTEKFGESRREIREVGSELGRLAGVSGAGGLALGGVGAAAFSVGLALEFLEDTWKETSETIKGPIEVGLPPTAPAHISAAAEAWKDYATARAAAMASSQGAEGIASIEEKRLANELNLIKQVLAAEKEKALADLELRKEQMTPDQYAAAKDNIGNIFGEAGTAAEKKNRRALIANKDMEATNLEIDAKNKTAQALAIKSSPADVVESNQKTLDDNAAAAETAKKEIQERIALIERVRKYRAGEDVPEYEGSFGKIQKVVESFTGYKRYGNLSFEDARKIEEPRLAQAQAQIDEAASYRKRQAAAAEEKKKLMDEAGTESGKAAVLRGQITEDSRFEGQQNAVDDHVQKLHRASGNVKQTSAQAVAAMQHLLAATLGGFGDIHAVLIQHQQKLEQQRRQISSMSRTGGT